MAKSIVYWLMPAGWTRATFDTPQAAEFWAVLSQLNPHFTNSFRMPGTRALQGWQVVNMAMDKPAPGTKGQIWNDLKDAAADKGWTLAKLDPSLTVPQLKTVVDAAGPKSFFVIKWHHPKLTRVFRQNGTPVLVGTGEDQVQKRIKPVYFKTPSWFIHFLSDVVVGGTPESPVMGRPSSIGQLNKWVHQDAFGEEPDELEEIVDNATPDE